MKERIILIDSKKKRWIDLKELYEYRDLFLILAYRDYRVRYAQTLLGFIWAFIQPSLTLLIMIFIFGKVAKIDTPVPYPLYAACGLTMWSYFAYVMAQSGNSIIASQQMIKKIYFPRLIAPLSKAVVGFVDFGISLMILGVLLIYYNQSISPNIVFLPVFILLGVVSALAVGIWLSALTVRYRDFQHMVPFMVQLGLYITPIAYPISLVANNLPEHLTIIYFLNPIAGVIEGFRWSILGEGTMSYYTFISFSAILVILLTGLFYFKRIEGTMADLI